LKPFAQMPPFMGMDMNKLLEGAGLRAPGLERRTFRPPVTSADRMRDKRKRKEARRARKRNKGR
jgi:hypothetical protein